MYLLSWGTTVINKSVIMEIMNYYYYEKCFMKMTYTCGLLFVPHPEASGVAVRVGWGEPEPGAGGAESVQEAVSAAGLMSHSRSVSNDQGWQRKPTTQRSGASLHCRPLRRTGLSLLHSNVYMYWEVVGLGIRESGTMNCSSINIWSMENPIYYTTAYSSSNCEPNADPCPFFKCITYTPKRQSKSISKHEQRFSQIQKVLKCWIYEVLLCYIDNK